MLINVDSIYEIKDTPQVGYLYIFDASHYDNDLTICLNDTVKIGMTAGNIKTRLNQYKSIPKIYLLYNVLNRQKEKNY